VTGLAKLYAGGSKGGVRAPKDSTSGLALYYSDNKLYKLGNTIDMVRIEKIIENKKQINDEPLTRGSKKC
jgi:hypothetical protein